MTPETRTARARDLRKRQTYPEAILWQYLRASRLDGLKFRRQHPIDRYFADFACESLMLVIELDGKVHDEDEQQLNDYHRQQAIETLGWSVIRFTNDQVTDSLPTSSPLSGTMPGWPAHRFRPEMRPSRGDPSPAPAFPNSNPDATPLPSGVGGSGVTISAPQTPATRLSPRARKCETVKAPLPLLTP